MSRPILIKGSTSKTVTILLAVVGVGLLITAVVVAVVSAQPVVGALVGLIGAGFCAAAGITHFVRVQGLVYLQVHDDGFVVRDVRTELEHLDEDVRGLATEVKPVYANGVPTAVRRRATLQVSAGPAGTVEMNYTFPLGNATDPLAGLFDRLQELLLARFRQEIATGRRVTGDGWHLDQDGLSIDRGEGKRRYPYTDLAAVSVVDHKVNVWERGRAEATIQVPARALNAWALVPLLQDRLPRDSGGAEEDVGEGMGRVIFQRNKSWSTAGMVGGYVAAVLLVLLGALVAVAGVAGGAMAAVLVGLGLVVGGGATAAAAYFNRVNIFRAHALGVTRITATGHKEMRYDEVGTFTWQATRNFVNGAYTGTSMKLAFQPRPGVDAPAITYSTTLKGNDDELDNLRDFISQVIASRWLKALQEGRTVRWTTSSTFHPDGLEHTKGWFGGAKVMPYSAVLSHNFKDGWLYLFGAASTKPLVQEQVNQPNFFPGFALLMLILSQGGTVHGRGEAPRDQPRVSPPEEEQHHIRRGADRDEERPRVRRRADDDDY
jgi:hypothetical protein